MKACCRWELPRSAGHIGRRGEQHRTDVLRAPIQTLPGRPIFGQEANAIDVVVNRYSLILIDCYHLHGYTYRNCRVPIRAQGSAGPVLEGGELLRGVGHPETAGHGAST